MTVAIVWFRRDLRVHDNPLLAAAQRYDEVLPLFIIDEKITEGRRASAARNRFIAGCLEDLDLALRRLRSRLLVLCGEPAHQLRAIASDLRVEAVLWSGDVSPYSRARDRRVHAALRELGVRAIEHPPNHVVDVGQIETGAAKPYQMHSPFHRRSLTMPRRPLLPAPRRLPPPPDLAGLSVLRQHPRLLLEALVRHPPSPHPLATPAEPPAPIAQPGETAARRALSRWLSSGLHRYAHGSQTLAEGATSRLSPHLRFGCLSALELEQRALQHPHPSAQAWVRQLSWRDFFAHVLLHSPGNLSLEHQAQLRGMEWEEHPERLVAWQQGITGFPIVDAAMRQLARTGWMPNRARLIVGSFLTKDLQIDWRQGEEWFSRLLLDGDPAQNNGNWQWIASVGTDPAPVARRLYNPTLQSQRHDPDGLYIRRWVPELSAVPLSALHQPSQMSECQQRRSGCWIGRDYPAPIVDHPTQRALALERYRRSLPPPPLEAASPPRPR